MFVDTLLDTAATQTRNIIIPKDWSQGRTAFGGLSAGMLYQAMRSQVALERVLRSYHTNFVGPLLVGEAAEIAVTVHREGKNTAMLEAKFVQGGQTCVVSQACFGVARESKIQVHNNDVHDMPQAKKSKFIPQIPGITPKYLKHIDFAIIDGKLPFTGSKLSHFYGYMRFKQAPEKITDGHLITLIDAWPPTVLQMALGPVPASTMSWNLEFIHPHAPVNPTDWFAYQAQTRQAADGYAHSEANIWDHTGRLVAISRQCITVFG